MGDFKYANAVNGKPYSSLHSWDRKQNLILIISLNSSNFRLAHLLFLSVKYKNAIKYTPTYKCSPAKTYIRQKNLNNFKFKSMYHFFSFLYRVNRGSTFSFYKKFG